MAFIPDEAVDRMAELSAGAWRLYCFLARCRNGKTGKCCPSIRVTAEAIDVHPKNVFKLRNELVTAGWATFNADHAILILGYVSSKNATADVEAIEDTAKSSENTTNEADGSKNATAEEVMVAKTLPVVAKTLLDGSKNATAYKEEPAKEPANRTSKGKGARAPDPRTQHVAIQTVRGIASLYPPKALWDDLISLLGDSPDAEKLMACWKEWVKRGWRPTNWSWVFDWYTNGIPEWGNGNGKTQTSKTGNDANRGSAQRTTEEYGIRDCEVL